MAENQPEKYEPEPENEGIIVKPPCECPTCDYWMRGVDWCPPENAECHKVRQAREKKLQPLLKSEKHPGKTPSIRSYNPDRLTKVERRTISKTLVHGEVIPEPVKTFSETYFSPDVQRSLEVLNYRYSLPIQSFGWPAIFRQMNVFMIGGPKSGKTLAYLPAICTFCTVLEERYKDLSRHKGPLAIIVCPTSRQCEEILDLIKKLYGDAKGTPKIAILTYPVSNIHNMDILITIPDSLTHCLKMRIFNLKRLCHLVLEDTSTLLKNHEKSIYSVLEVADEMLEHRSSSTKVQLIVTSEKWTSDLKKLLTRVYLTPLVCINNYLEAALYGNIKFEVKFLVSDKKLEYLQGVLKTKYRFYKTVVVCNQSEIVEVSKSLVRKGINTITLSDNSSKEEIEEYELEWSFTPGGHNKVLLCTDFVFNSLLCVNDAIWLINYSFPSTWTRFIMRFSALSTHYKSPLDENEGGPQCKSIVMIDETCEKQMSKILNLLNRLTKDLPMDYQKYAEGFRKNSELDKLERKVELCDTLKLFGKCTYSLCEKRHCVSGTLDVSEDLPRTGKVTFRILNLKDVTQCTVQLIDQINPDGFVTRINGDDLRKPLIYDENEEVECVQEVTMGNFYAHCDYTTNGEQYSLCLIQKIERDTIEVKVTSGLTLQTRKTNLFEVPQKLKHSIVDVYFCNLIPPFNDRHFSGRSFYVTRKSLQELEYKTRTLTGTILLQLDRTLYLDDVIEVFNIEGTEVVKFNLTKHLIQLNVVEPSTNQISYLHKLCTKYDIFLPNLIKQAAKKTVKSKEIEPQRAFLDDNIHEVILNSAVSPDEFYVRLAKFQPLLESLEKDIQTAVENEIFDKNLNIEVGKYYLVWDSTSQKYSRAKILYAENNKALCFYVDYGDEAIVELDNIKLLPTKFITRLPFQAIQCRLFGLSPSFGEWDVEATDLLYNYILEPNSDIFRSLYVEVGSKDDGDMIRAKVKYSVLLKDGYGEKKTLLNQLMLDCGHATSIFDKIDDFTLPEPEVAVSDSDSVEETVEDVKDIEEFLEGEFDFEIPDACEFWRVLGMPDLKQIQSEPPREVSPEVKDIEPLTVQIEEPTCLTPEVYWSQTDKTVKLKIKLIGVEKYKVNLIRKRIFTFSTHLEEKPYEVKFTLYKPAEMSRHRACGQEVQVILNKVESVEWLQLTGTSKRLRFIHYEIPDVEEPKPRRFLTLDITDDESDDDDPDQPMIYDISDLDSEFAGEEFSTSESD